MCMGALTLCIRSLIILEWLCKSDYKTMVLIIISSIALKAIIISESCIIAISCI